MARDATNMPFPRSTSYQESDSTEHSNDSNGKLDASLKIENMLLEEFNYASLTAYQSMEDRARISSFYYVLLGVLASGLAAIYQLNQSTHAVPQFLVIGLLMVGAIISITFCLAGAVFLITEQPLTNLGASILAVIVFVVAVLLHIFYYRRALSKRKEAKAIREEAEEMGIVLPNPTE